MFTFEVHFPAEFNFNIKQTLGLGVYKVDQKQNLTINGDFYNYTARRWWQD